MSQSRKISAAAGVVALLGAWSVPASAELPVEQISVASLPPASPYRLYLTDVALPHLPDGKMFLIDGRTLKVEGTIGTGMFSQSTLSPDRSEIYVMATYYAKLNRGERIEEIDVYDAATLKLKAEIPYPAHHAQALPYVGTLRTTGDGRFILVQNATPATSVSIVNRETGKQVAEVQTPGCYIVYPAKTTNRFSTLCGDGTMLTVSLDEQGNPVGKKKSAKFFDPEGDALFVSAAQVGDTYHFVSFKGNVQSVNVAGETAVPEKPWSLLTAADAKQGWRPGGYQPLAVHVASGTAYVGVHPKGYEGSHKDPAKEIWVVDLASKTRLDRVKTAPATTLTVSQGDNPRLFAMSVEGGAMVAFDGGRKLKKAKVTGAFGDTPTQLEAQ